jgi:mRNA-degrading endonuclease RelE of RelBE toxin-antitoxin system
MADETEEHLRTLSSRQQRTVLVGIEKQLTHEPSVVTRNRKLMRPNPLASWELRIGNLRVYYDVEEEERIVYILAIGLKDRNQVRIGKEVITL